MEPVRTNARQTDESGRASKKAVSRLNSMNKSNATAVTKVVNGRAVQPKSSLTVTSQKSQTRALNTRKSVTRTVQQVKRSAAQDDVPGPGSHDVKGMGFGENARGFKITQPARESKLSQSPGPGDYEIGRSDSVTK